MKKFSLIALSLVASTVFLSACGEKKIEPNNYYCTNPFDGGKYGTKESFKELARQGRIDDPSDFMSQCISKKLGSYGEELRNLRKKLQTVCIKILIYLLKRKLKMINVEMLQKS